MKCTNKSHRKHKYSCQLIAILLAAVLVLTGCGSGSYRMKYSLSSYESESSTQMVDTFASNLCVADSNISDSSISLSQASCAGLFDLNNKKTLYAVNVNQQVNPASLTKVMTALVALKYGKLDQVLTASSDVYISESGAQLIGLKEGDQMTLDQALHLLLIYSANDVAVMIAENIGGSMDAFIKMMNEEAVSIGATGSHFANPHGLTADNHYVTPYDMYLIFNAAMQYDEFQQIINTAAYTTQYTNKSGTAVDVNIHSTNLYIKGTKDAPTNITVIGGKTGTTNAAGHCLILLAKDKSGNPYIAVVMRAEDSDTLYNEMTSLLDKIVN